MRGKFQMQLKQLLDKTAETGKEYAVPICEDGTLGQATEGSDDTVSLSQNGCKKIVASFHTHPQNYQKDEDAFFSAVDQVVSRRLGVDHHCLGYFVKGKPKMMCGKPLDPAKTKVFLDLENAGRTINEMYRYNVLPAASYQQFYDVYRELGLAFPDGCREEL